MVHGKPELPRLLRRFRLIHRASGGSCTPHRLQRLQDGFRDLAEYLYCQLMTEILSRNLILLRNKA